MNKTIDGVWPTESDLENELEVRAKNLNSKFNFCENAIQQQKRVKNIGWSSWSEWSTCSRSCDGGVAQQLRRCRAPNGCRGEPVRHKICNMQVRSLYNVLYRFVCCIKFYSTECYKQNTVLIKL